MKILVVDDHPLNRNFLKAMLIKDGYEVALAADGVEALEKLRSENFDLIISDIQMPVMDGFRLCREVQIDKDLKDIPVVFYSATFLDQKDKELAFKLGAHRFIQKPEDRDELVKIIEGLLKYKDSTKSEVEKISIESDTEIFRLYSERMVEKLEKRTQDLKTKIAEHEQAEDALRESEAKYRAMFENNPIQTAVVDREGRIIAFNKAKALSGDRIPNIGDIMFKDYARDYEINMYDELMECIRSGEIKELNDLKYTDKFFSVKLSPFSKGAIITSIDITSKKLTEENLHQTLTKLRKSLGSTIQAMAYTVETRDPYTAGHQRRVTNLARIIADEMSLSAEEIDGIRMAGVIHDIGKISVPAEILSKPTRLTNIEFELIKVHSQTAFEILKEIEFPWPIAQIVYQHHERVDGSGYPQGISGSEILIEAKVIAVSDVVEAMASHRPYRPGLGIDKALEEIQRNKGISYDPKVVDTCLKLFTEKGFEFE